MATTALEAAAVAITVLAVYLTARQVIWCWGLSMLSVSLYAAVFWQARLYAEVGLQILYFALSAYGWWAWMHGGGDGGELRVATTPTRRRWALTAVGAVCGLLLGAWLARFTAASFPYLDSQLASFSVVAQWLQTRKYLEAWIVWVVLDVAYVGMFAAKQLWPTAILYAAFLALAVNGLRQWRASMATAP